MGLKDPGKIIKNIGRRIGEVREHQGLKQSELADKLGMSTRHLQRCESGMEVRLTVETLVRIANALSVDYREFQKAPKTNRPKPGRPKIKHL